MNFKEILRVWSLVTTPQSLFKRSIRLSEPSEGQKELQRPFKAPIAYIQS